MALTCDLFVALQIAELAGYTARVYNMFSVFEEVKRGIYKMSNLTAERESSHKKKNKAKQCINGPLEIKGNRYVSVSWLLLFLIFHIWVQFNMEMVRQFISVLKYIVFLTSFVLLL